MLNSALHNFCHYQNNHVKTDTSQLLVVTVSIVTILDNFDPISNMLVSTWLASTALNSKEKNIFCNDTQISLLDCKLWCLIVTFLKVTR